MANPRIGAVLPGGTAPERVANIKRAEELGVPAAWMVGGGGTGSETLMAFAAAAMVTSTIKLGTCIVTVFPRHPLVMAGMAGDIAALAPGRFTLGVGASTKAFTERVFGLPYERPLEYLREYVQVLKLAMTTGAANFEGKRFKVHARMPFTSDVPVIISALGPKAYEMAGEMTDGTVSWVTPAAYLRDVARPALEAGARKAERPAPRMIGHAMLCLSEDRDEVKSLVGGGLGMYAKAPPYAAMFVGAGFTEAKQGEWSDGLMDAVTIWGDEARAAEQVQAFLETSTADELILTLSLPGPDRKASLDRALRFVAGL
ncbi:MAG: LLM class flavin-dependent oxidoreductase [Chloroflexi bacterium]|nr:LLM class flavin-dependent oxidoreductase [Chloroflexota bacterium]